MEEKNKSKIGIFSLLKTIFTGEDEVREELSENDSKLLNKLQAESISSIKEQEKSVTYEEVTSSNEKRTNLDKLKVTPSDKNIPKAKKQIAKEKEKEREER